MVRFAPPKKSEQQLPKQEPAKKKEQPDRIDWLERKCKKYSLFSLTLEHSHLKPLETLLPISSDLLHLDSSLSSLLKNTHTLLKNTDTQSKESRDFIYNLQIIDTSKETPLDKLESLNSNMQQAFKNIRSYRLKQLIDMKVKLYIGAGVDVQRSSCRSAI
jgi:hypothetical protein